LSICSYLSIEKIYPLHMFIHLCLNLFFAIITTTLFGISFSNLSIFSYKHITRTKVIGADFNLIFVNWKWRIGVILQQSKGEKNR